MVFAKCDICSLKKKDVVSVEKFNIIHSLEQAFNIKQRAQKVPLESDEYAIAFFHNALLGAGRQKG
jgi:hypothetical protein